MLKFIGANGKTSPALNTKFCEFAAQYIFNQPNDFGPCGSLGIFRNKKLIAVVVFHNWQEQAGVIELSAAAISPLWLTKQTIREVMAICFSQHKCQQIVARMARDNERAWRIFRFLGFKGILLPNMRGSGKHEWLMLLTSDQWKANKLNEVNIGQTERTNSEPTSH